MMAWVEMDMDFRKRDSRNVFQISRLARKSLKFCGNIVSMQNSFKKLLYVIYLEFIKFVFDKFSEHFLHL